MNWRTKIALSSICCTIVIGCTPPILRPILETIPKDVFLDYQAELVFHPETTLNVTLLVPPNVYPCDSFCFPIQIPGAYAIFRYGKFIDQFDAYGSDGKPMTYSKVDSTFYTVNSGTNPVNKIRYVVHPSSMFRQDSIPPFAGTRLKPDHCILNPYAIFGFFPNLKEMPIRIRLILPENWTLGTSLDIDSAGTLYAQSYDDLQDNPILAGNLSQYAFESNGKQFFVYSFSDDPELNARRLRHIVKNSVKDADNFTEGFIPNNYSFLFTFIDDSSTSGGAHEHSRSSLYCFSTRNTETTIQELEWIVRHELFHTLVPLELKGDEIKAVGFKTVHPVSQLWFYEGLAQWSAFKMRLISGAITPDNYLKIMQRILLISDTKSDTLDFLTLSQEVLQNRPYLSDIYRRGFIFGTLLDMYIIYKTDGKTTLRDVLLKMKTRYPREKPFETDSLFSIIAAMTHPDVKGFLEDHLERNLPLNTADILGYLGIEYTVRQKHPVVVSEFGVSLHPSDDNKYLLIGDAYPEATEFDYIPGDTLLTVDNVAISPANFAFTVRNLSSSNPGIHYIAEVCGKDGKKRKVNAVTVPYYVRHKMEIADSENKLHYVWLTR